MLSIKLSDLTDEGVIVTQSKTGTRLLYAWTMELRAAVDEVMRLAGPIRGMHLFARAVGYRIHRLDFDPDLHSALLNADFFAIISLR